MNAYTNVSDLFGPVLPANTKAAAATAPGSDGCGLRRGLVSVADSVCALSKQLSFGAERQVLLPEGRGQIQSLYSVSLRDGSGGSSLLI